MDYDEAVAKKEGGVFSPAERKRTRLAIDDHRKGYERKTWLLSVLKVTVSMATAAATIFGLLQLVLTYMRAK